MDANVQVVKEITKALGDGVDKLTPVATEIIRQYQMQQLVDGIAGIGLFIIAIIISIIMVKKIDWEDDNPIIILWIMLVVLIFIAIVVGFIMAVSGFEGYVAPISGFIRAITN